MQGASGSSPLGSIYKLLTPGKYSKYFISSCNRFRFTLDNEINFKILDNFNIKESLTNKKTYKFYKNIENKFEILNFNILNKSKIL